MFKVTQENNFCYVFEMPRELPSDYCFGGGHPVQFRMVDWFNPVPTSTFMPPPEYIVWKDGECELSIEAAEKLREDLREFLRVKRYRKVGHDYIVVTRYGDAFLVN